MRIGIVSPDVSRGEWESWIKAIERADRLGVDVLLIRENGDVDSLMLASTVSARTSRLHVAVEIEALRERHPLHLAERIAVADQCLGGRLHVVLRNSSHATDPGPLIETLNVIELALTSRPFSYCGELWRIPDPLEGDSAGAGRTVTVTPPPAQLAVPLWLSGVHLMDLAIERDLVWLGEQRDGVFLSHVLATLEHNARLVPRVYGWPRKSDGSIDVDSLVHLLVTDSADQLVNLAFLPIAVTDVDALEVLMRKVRPRAQLSELPQGLVDFWEDLFSEESG